MKFDRKDYPIDCFYAEIESSLNMKLMTAYRTESASVKLTGVLPSCEVKPGSDPGTAPFNCCIGDYVQERISYAVPSYNDDKKSLYKSAGIPFLGETTLFADIPSAKLDRLLPKPPGGAFGIFSTAGRLREECSKFLRSEYLKAYSRFDEYTRKFADDLFNLSNFPETAKTGGN